MMEKSDLKPVDMLRLESLSVAYGEKVVLRNVELNLEEGCVLALIGPNGAGKSTLIRAVSGLIPHQHGRIFVAGEDMERLSLIERSRRMAVVPQARNLPGTFTGWDTVSLGRTPYLNWLGQLSEQDEAIIADAMAQTDTRHLAERLVGECSGGEAQRLLLARALTQEAPLLLMDEPTTHLDLQYQFNLMELVRRLAHPDSPEIPPRAVLIAIHDLNLVARFADRVALLVKGQLMALGTPDEVLQPDLLSQAYRIPIEVFQHQKYHFPVVIPGGELR